MSFVWSNSFLRLSFMLSILFKMPVVLRTLYTILDLTGQQLHARMHAIILSLVLYASVERDANNLAYLPTNRIFTDKMVTASMINCIWSISNGLPWSSAGVEIFNSKLWQPGSSATYLPTSRSINKLFSSFLSTLIHSDQASPRAGNSANTSALITCTLTYAWATMNKV